LLKRIIGKEGILALGLSALMLISLFGIHLFQAGSFEYLSTKDVIVRYTMACFDSNESSPSYGGFVPSVEWTRGYRYFDTTRKALELLVQLDAVNKINETAVLRFLNTSEIRVIYESGYYHTYYSQGMDCIYNALLILKASNKLDLADSLINMSALHSMLVNQLTANVPGPLWANVFVANFLGWMDDLNKTWYAEGLYHTIMRFIMSNYGCSSSLGYGFTDFYEICRYLMALSMVGGVEAFTSDMVVITDFEHLVRTFLLLRWDGYNGGFADDIGGRRSTHIADPRFVVASVKPSYVSLQLAKQMRMDLPGMLSGTEESVNDAFARLVRRSQTKYGFFKGSLPYYMLYNYPTDADPWDYEIEDNYYAVSLLNLVNRMQILDEGRFRWPPDRMTLVETCEKEGYLIPLIAAMLIVPILTAVLVKKVKTRYFKRNL